MSKGIELAQNKREERGIRRVDLAYVQLASSEIARDINRDVVLELIRARQPISRADLARLSGLQRSTISLIVEELLEQEWIKEGAVARRPRGRRPTLLNLNDDLAMVVCDIRPMQAVVAVVDLNGRFLAREALPLLSDPAKAVAQLIERMKRLQQKHARKSFEGIGVSLPGRVDPVSQALIFAPNLKWPKFDIKKAIERGMGLKVEMDNAANACLLSELWFGHMDGVRNAVLVTISEGIGTGILANGQLVLGSSGMAGEFGHVPMDPSGPKCACGACGCWETLASSNAALRYYAELSRDARGLTMHDLIKRADEGDRHAHQAIEKQAHWIGRGLRAALAALSPEVILIAGDVTSAWSRVAPIVQQELAALVLAGPAPRIMAVEESEVARLRGAAALVLQRHTGQQPVKSRPHA
ncbi:MAG: ROK family transcriptional regulator [Candidatus Binataceae bacterium]